MTTKIVRLEEIDSTNIYLREWADYYLEDMVIATAEYQTRGKGQGRNSWESEKGKNLLFSILVRPQMIPVKHQFILSVAGALALKKVLDYYVTEISLKWPNDIYWKDRKLSGTLIETSIDRNSIKKCIFGVGLNVNQLQFLSDAPNPVSLAQILGHELDRNKLLDEVIEAFTDEYEMLCSEDHTAICANYFEALYRREGYFKYRDAAGLFEARIDYVNEDGHLILQHESGEYREYAFKEVEFII